jgi:hypothetical protein
MEKYMCNALSHDVSAATFSHRELEHPQFVRSLLATIW